MDQRDRDIQDLRSRIQSLQWDLEDMESELERIEDGEPPVVLDPSDPFTCHVCKWLRPAGPTCDYTKGIIPAGFVARERVKDGDRCGNPPPKPQAAVA